MALGGIAQVVTDECSHVDPGSVVSSSGTGLVLPPHSQISGAEARRTGCIAVQL